MLEGISLFLEPDSYSCPSLTLRFHLELVYFARNVLCTYVCTEVFAVFVYAACTLFYLAHIFSHLTDASRDGSQRSTRRYLNLPAFGVHAF